MNLEGFYRLYRPKIQRTVRRYAKSPQQAQDWTQDIILKIWEGPNRSQIENMDAWVFTVAKRYCLDQIKKAENKKREDIDVAEFEDGSPGPETEYKEHFPYYCTIKEKDHAIAAGLKRSLEYVAEFFRLQQALKPGTEIRKEWEARDILEEAREKLSRKFGRVADETCWKYEMLALEKGPFDPFGGNRCRTADEEAELKKLELDPRKIRLHTFLWRPLSELDNRFTDPAFNPHIPLVSDIDEFFANRPRTDIFRLKIDPLKVLFCVWRRALRKGPYQNNALAISLLYDFKKMTKGQDKEFLFKSLRGETRLDQKMRFETLRTKSIKAMKTPLNRDLVEFIFRKSFTA